MDKLQQAIQEELANRLKSGKIKSSKDLSDLFTEMYRMGIQEMLKAEMDEYLGYEKNAPESVQYSNSRNGHSRRKSNQSWKKFRWRSLVIGKELLNLSWFLDVAASWQK